jgi:DnaJ-class molecular chaperone
MQKYVKKSCPICNGSRTMSIIEYVGLLKKLVRVPCTACEGKGKINFLDKSISEVKSRKLGKKSIFLRMEKVFVEILDQKKESHSQPMSIKQT